MTEMEQALEQAREELRAREQAARDATEEYVQALKAYIEQLENWRAGYLIAEHHRDSPGPLARHYSERRQHQDARVKEALAEVDKARYSCERSDHAVTTAQLALRMMEVEDMGENPEKYLEKYRAGSK